MTATELAEIRRGLGLTQADLALALGTTQKALSKWERGERRVPRWVPMALVGVRTALNAAMPGVLYEVRDRETGEPAPVAADTMAGAKEGLELMRAGDPSREYEIVVRFEDGAEAVERRNPGTRAHC